MLRVLSLQWKSSEYLSSWKCFEIHNLSPLDKKLCKKFSFAQDSVGTLRVSVSLFSLYTLWGSLSWNMFGNKILQILLVIKIEYFKKWKCSHFFFFLMPSLPSEKAVKYKKESFQGDVYCQYFVINCPFHSIHQWGRMTVALNQRNLRIT